MKPEGRFLVLYAFHPSQNVPMEELLFSTFSLTRCQLVQTPLESGVLAKSVQCFRTYIQCRDVIDTLSCYVP